MSRTTKHSQSRIKSPHRQLVLHLTVALLLATPALASGLDAQAEIARVTVYRDLAEVVRSADLELPAGPATVVFRDLPRSAEAGSLRLRTDDDAVRIGMVAMESRVDDSNDPEVQRLRDDKARLQDAVDEIQVADEIAGSLRTYLRSVLDSSARLEGSKVFNGGGEPTVILGVYEMVRDELTELARADFERRPRLRELKAALSAAQARLDELENGANFQRRDVWVELEVDRPGPIRLELGYVVRGASWTPAYRAELDSDGERLQFVTEAVVTQATGEDWEGVQLHLSSAVPSSRLAPPQLESWWLRAADREARAARGKDPLTGQLMSAVNPDSIEGLAVITAGEGVEYGRAQGGYASVVATPSSSGYTVTFSVPGQVTLETGDRSRRVTLRSEELEAEIVHRAVPARDARAYLVVNTHSPSDYPLLAGSVRVYHGAAYLGSSRLTETGPGAELSLPFGADNRVELTHVPSRFEARGGWSGKQRQMSRSARTLIRNLYGRTIQLIVEAQLPVAQDERIQVQLTRQTTPGYTPSNHRPGVVLWELELSYEVRHPSDVTLLATR